MYDAKDFKSTLNLANFERWDEMIVQKIVGNAGPKIPLDIGMLSHSCLPFKFWIDTQNCIQPTNTN